MFYINVPSYMYTKLCNRWLIILLKFRRKGLKNNLMAEIAITTLFIRTI